MFYATKTLFYDCKGFAIEAVVSASTEAEPDDDGGRPIPSDNVSIDVLKVSYYSDQVNFSDSKDAMMCQIAKAYFLYANKEFLLDALSCDWVFDNQPTQP